jgi:hypothetical protein
MRALAAAAGHAIAGRWTLWAGIALGFVVAYNLMLLVALIVRFGDLPNYATVYDYPDNVLRIIASTPSALDAVEIIRDEWLLEIGFMNYSFGNGISEWSLTILPAKLVVLLAVGSLLATAIVLALPARDGSCAVASGGKAIGAASGGAALVGFSSATLSWVVCCAAPTWVVSLAMLGMSASLALWLRPFGDVITASGFALLAAAVVILARRRSGLDAAAPQSAGSRASTVSP